MSAKLVQSDLFAPISSPVAPVKKEETATQLDRILSVGEVTAKIKSLLEGSFPAIWVRGEVSNLRKQASGHIYFTLKDDSSALSVVLFRPNVSTAKLLAEGAQLLIYGELSVYEPRGNYQLVARAVVPDGKGRLQLELMRLKELLQLEGIFSKKKELPRLPMRVALITSPTGAALQDMLSIFARRDWPGKLTVIPALVQGEGAAASLKSALSEALNGSFELIIFARGGGSIEDLWCFNDEHFVRAVADSGVPTLSAVGHEIDFTLTDFAADLRCETPTAAAEWLCTRVDEARGQVKLLKHRLESIATERISAESLKLERMGTRWLRVRPSAYIEGRMQRLDELTHRLGTLTQKKMTQLDSRLAFCKKGLESTRFTERIQGLRQRVSFLNKQLTQGLQRNLLHRKERIEHLNVRLENLGTQRTLRRGFTILQDAVTGDYLTSVQAVHPQQKIRAIFHDGDTTLG